MNIFAMNSVFYLKGSPNSPNGLSFTDSVLFFWSLVRREITKYLTEHIISRHRARNHRRAFLEHADQESAPFGERSKWITKANPTNFRLEWAEAEGEKYEEMLGYDPDAEMAEDTSGARPTVTGRNMHVSEAVAVLQLVEATEAHITEVRRH